MSCDLETVRQRLEKDQFAATMGVELVELRPGYGKAKMRIEPKHSNGIGVVQGGAIFTLADFAFAAASNSAGQVVVGISTTMAFLKPGKAGTLWAEAAEVSRTRRTSVCEVRVTDDAGQLIALFQGTGYVKSEKIVEE